METSPWSEVEPVADAEPATRNSVMVVYRAIKRKILTGEVKGGELLPQSRLATEFSTSRGPVREALRLLQREGLIEAETNQRARVASFDASDLEQVSAAMVLNIGAAIHVGARRLTRMEIAAIVADIDRIEKLAQPAGKAGPGRAAREEHRQSAFHDLVVKLCRKGGNQAAHIVEGLFDQIAIFRQMGSARMGEPTTFALPERLSDLKSATERSDGPAMAVSVVTLIEHLAHFALSRLTDGYVHRLLDDHVALVKRAIAPDANPAADGPAILPLGTTLSVHSLPHGRIAYSLSSD